MSLAETAFKLLRGCFEKSRPCSATGLLKDNLLLLFSLVGYITRDCLHLTPGMLRGGYSSDLGKNLEGLCWSVFVQISKSCSPNCRNNVWHLALDLRKKSLYPFGSDLVCPF